MPQAASLPPELDMLTSELIHEANSSTLSSYARAVVPQRRCPHAQEYFAECR